MTLQECVEKGITRIYQSQWKNKTDYIKIDIINGKLGPWLKLYSPINEVIGENNPQHNLWFQFGNAGTSDTWLEYTGEIDPDEKKELK